MSRTRARTSRNRSAGRRTRSGMGGSTTSTVTDGASSVTSTWVVSAGLARLLDVRRVRRTARGVGGHAPILPQKAGDGGYAGPRTPGDVRLASRVRLGEDAAPWTPTTSRQAAAKAGDHPVLENAARLGYAVNGLRASAHRLAGTAGRVGRQRRLGRPVGGHADPRPATTSDRVLLWIAVARLPRPGAVAGHGGHRRSRRDLGPAQGGRQGGRLPLPGLQLLHLRARQQQLVQQPAERRLHRLAHGQAVRPDPRRRRRRGRPRGRDLPRLQGVRRRSSSRTCGSTRASGSSRRPVRVHRPGRRLRPGRRPLRPGRRAHPAGRGDRARRRAAHPAGRAVRASPAHHRRRSGSSRSRVYLFARAKYARV